MIAVTHDINVAAFLAGRGVVTAFDEATWPHCLDAAVIIRKALGECGGGGCENCSSCWLGGGSPSEIYADYIEGKRELAAINREYNARYLQGRVIH